MHGSDGTTKASRRRRRAWPFALGGLGSAPALLGLAAVGARHGAMLAALDARSEPPLVVQSALLTVLGVHRLLRALAHLADPSHRADTGLRGQARKDVVLALVWSASGIVLTWLAAGGVSPLIVSLAGAAVTAFVLVQAYAISADTARLQGRRDIDGARAWFKSTRIGGRWYERAEHAEVLPASRRFRKGFERRQPLGQITSHLGRTLTMLACVLTAYAGVATAQVTGHLLDHAPKRKPASRHGELPRTYAGFCPALPDPLKIGHGLGTLFQHDGAIQAGCGHRAHAVSDDGAVWIAEGMCDDELRSLAVASTSGTVLLYGEAARLAHAFAQGHVLRFAERVPIAGGEVVVLGTTGGSYVMARVTPSLRPSRGPATSCEQVSDVARPYAILPPPLAALWQVEIRRHGWSWPVRDSLAGPRTFTFVSHRTGATVAHARCWSASACTLSDDDGRTTSAGTPTVTGADLQPYAP